MKKPTKEGMKKFFLNIGVKNIVITAVVVLLGVAVFLNYKWFYQPDDTDAIAGDQSTAGDTAPEQQSDYFSAVALSRKQARDEALEVLQASVDSTEMTDEEKQGALAQISKIAGDMEKEANIETLVLSHGYDNCVAVISGDTASVIVDAGGEGLLATQVAQITSIVYEQAGIIPANLSIYPK